MAGEGDFERVVFPRLCAAQSEVGGGLERFARGWRAAKPLFGLKGPPGFGGDAAQGEPRLTNTIVLERDNHGRRGESEFKTLPVAQF